MKKDFLTLSGLIKKGSEVVGVKVIIRDGLAMSTFTKKGLALDLYHQLKLNNKKTAYNDEYGAVIEYFDGKTKEEIGNILKKEIRDGGGEFKNEI